MDLNFQQHRLLKQLEQRGGTVPAGELQPRSKAGDRQPLAEAKLIELGKQGRSMTISLTDAGRRLLAEQAEPPPKKRPQRAPRRPKPPTPDAAFPFPAHRLFMLKLAFAPPGASADGLSKVLKPAERARLGSEKWIADRSTSKRKLHVELTDAGWQWVEAHLADGVGGSTAGDVLGAVLARVGDFLSANNLRLADLLRAKPVGRRSVSPIHEGQADDGSAPGDGGPGGDRAAGSPPGDGLPAAIQAACGRLAHNALSPHVMLADLRTAVGAWDREAVDAALLELERDGRVKLVGIDDPRRAQPRDHEAALRTPSGALRHLVYWIAQ